MKTRILFVDDEPNVLSALRRMFHDMRGEWEMDFASDGPSGLAMIAEQPYDVVVADMRMPGMDGAMFLREAQVQNPGAIRIVLSGHSDRDMILQTVRPAHQFLQKPCQPAELKAVIARGLSLREVFLDLDDPRRRVAAGERLAQARRPVGRREDQPASGVVEHVGQ